MHVRCILEGVLVLHVKQFTKFAGKMESALKDSL
jgi:hypothetical protein